MRAQLRRMGNSSGIIIPKPVLAQLGVTPGCTAVKAGSNRTTYR